MVVFSSEYGASSDFSGGERSSKVTSSTVVSGYFRQYAGLRVPSRSFWRIGRSLENCELGEEAETASVEVDGLFGLYLDHETAFFHVFQTFFEEGENLLSEAVQVTNSNAMRFWFDEDLKMLKIEVFNIQSMN